MTSHWQRLGIMCVGFVILGCSMIESTEILILLPGSIDGNALVLAETSATNISINEDLVPSLILEVWWDAEVIVTKNHPMKPRNKFSGDTYQVPDRKAVCWYLVHPATDSVVRFDDYALLQKKLASLGVDPSDVKLMPLRHAQSHREEELGFEFSPSSVNQYIRTQTSAQEGESGR